MPAIYSTRAEARRLFGLIAAGSTLSNVLFGALLSWFAKQVDPADLLFFMAAGSTCCALCAGVLGHCCREALETTAAESENAHQSTTAENSILGAFRAMWQSPLLVSLAAIVILVDLVSKIADYQLDLALQAHYGGDSQGMVELLGRRLCLRRAVFSGRPAARALRSGGAAAVPACFTCPGNGCNPAQRWGPVGCAYTASLRCRPEAHRQ